MRNRRIGILGGAFDPIHYGHIMIAKHCLHAYALDEIRFVPTAKPLLKNACIAKPWQRAAMIALAINDYPNFHLDTRELLRDTPSYAVLTLQSLQADLPHTELFWIVGADAFAEFPKWHRFEDIATLCDLLVVSRACEAEYAEHAEQRVMIESLFIEAGHCVYHSSMPLMNIASRTIRHDLVGFRQQIPESVWQLIVENNLYRQAVT